MSRVAARTLRIGLVADSHVGEFLEVMPDWVGNALEGSDLILHAGDLSVVRVLEDLERIAPVQAVRGDHDIDADALPEALVITAAGWRIGLIHGSGGAGWDVQAVARGVLGDRRWQPRLEARLRDRLGAVDAVVYGHWHLPRIAASGSTLMVCPGAVCPGGALGRDEPVPRSLHAPVDVAVRRFRARMHPEQHHAAVALLEVGSSGIRARHLTDPAAARAI